MPCPDSLAGMRSLVVVNHNATTTSARTLDVMLAALRHDLKMEVVETSYRGHAIDLARAARADGIDLVLALGGDGTVNEVVNGLLGGPDGVSRTDDDRPAGGNSSSAGWPATVPDLAVVPGGSTNVFARNLGIPDDPVEATGALLDAVRAGRRRPVGLGRLDDRWFTFCAGVGFDADVVRAVEQQRARGRKATTALYTRTAVRRFFAQSRRRRGGSITLERAFVPPVDGIALAIITNSAPWTYLGRRAVNPTPRASFESGLDVFALTKLGLAGTLRHLGEITMGGDRGARGGDVISLHDQIALTLSSDEPVPVQVDGDYIGERDQVMLRSVPRALNVVY
jgi:diacylglycerol kinase family enzyme